MLLVVTMVTGLFKDINLRIFSIINVNKKYLKITLIKLMFYITNSYSDYRSTKDKQSLESSEKMASSESHSWFSLNK